jgi:hypothetical protein
MSAQLCLLAFRNHWFEATELELIRNGFDAAKHAFENASNSSLLGKPSFVSLLYVTAQLNPTSFDRLHAMLEDEISSKPPQITCTPHIRD